MLEFKVYLDKKLIQRSLLSKGEITVGRSSENDLVLPNQHVSRLHLVIAQDGDTFRLEDRSSNGVLLDGKPVTGSTLLPPQCRLGVYPFEIDCSRRQDDQTAPIPKKALQAALQHADLSHDNTPQPAPLPTHFGILVGESAAMRQIYRLIEDVSEHAVTVLIRGEHGTGKELVARAIHDASPRRKAPFIAVNCAAIPLDLIESELFGHERGAFTGAQTAQKGKIEEADKGTLFLDEIGELSPAAQAKLLRFLQGKVIVRLGSAKEIQVDTRVVAATNKALERAVAEGTFRADLYYRIKVVEILLPPLRDRKEDIPLLAAHFLQRLAEEMNLPAKPMLTEEALHRLQAADWPGNVRQLENAFYSALVRSRSPQQLDEALLSDAPAWNSAPDREEEAPLDAISKELLLKILRESRWDTAKAAETLKVSRGTVYYKLKKYGINLREAAKRSANM